MQPLLPCSLCMWFWLCLFMWPGTRARLRRRANTIKARPYQLIRPEETDRCGHGSTPPPSHTHTAPSTKQTVRGSGLRLGFNPRSKQLLYHSLAWGSGGGRVCFFSPASAGPLFDFLFSENVTFVDRGQPLFLRGFVISCHLAKC